MSDPAVKETHNQNNETLYPLSADEIQAVQEMRKRKAQEKETQASLEPSPDVLRHIIAIREAILQMQREEEHRRKFTVSGTLLNEHAADHEHGK
jgi:hypothetical protein